MPFCTLHRLQSATGSTAALELVGVKPTPLHISPHTVYPYLRIPRGGVFLLQGGEFQRPWKRCSIIAKFVLEVEITMGVTPVPISVSSTHFALRYEVPKFLPSRLLHT